MHNGMLLNQRHDMQVIVGVVLGGDSLDQTSRGLHHTFGVQGPEVYRISFKPSSYQY